MGWCFGVRLEKGWSTVNRRDNILEEGLRPQLFFVKERHVRAFVHLMTLLLPESTVVFSPPMESRCPGMWLSIGVVASFPSECADFPLECEDFHRSDR